MDKSKQVSKSVKTITEFLLVLSALFATDLSFPLPSNAHISMFHIRIFKRVFIWLNATPCGPYDMDHMTWTISSRWHKGIASDFVSVVNHQLWLNINKGEKLLPGNKINFDFLGNRINHFLRALRHFSNTFMRHTVKNSLNMTRRSQILGDKMTNIKNLLKTRSI